MQVGQSASEAAAKTSEAPRHNLPLVLPSMIGRERELAELPSLLESDVHLLTLVGAGGCGKTRLALGLAHQLLERFSDGVWFVDLAPLDEPNLVPRAIADTLGLEDRGNPSPIEALAGALQFRSTMIVLDNCEHLVRACAEVAQTLVQRCSGLRILATSRESLRIPGESLRHLLPLATPDPGAETSLAQLTAYPAVQLFLTRARAVDPSFQLTEATASAVTQVCAQLGGLPLALELAAARVRVLTVPELAARLGDVFRVVSQGNRLSPPRHQTLKAALDWSYGLLTRPEQALLRRLTVFPGSWGFDAAERVCDGGEVDPAEMLDLLTQLVDKSLVVVDRRGQHTRYRLLEPIRRYAAEHLEASGDGELVRRRLAEHLIELAEAAESRLAHVGHAEWLEHLEESMDNFRTVLRWSMATGEQEMGLRLAAALWPLWDYRGHMLEGQHWLEQLLAGEPPNAHASAAVRMKALRVAGWQGVYQQLFDEETDSTIPVAHFAETLILARQLGDRVTEASALTGLGAAANWSAPSEDDHGYLQDGIRLWRELDDSSGLSFAMWLVGLRQFRDGDDEDAAAALEESLYLARSGEHVAPLRIGTTLLMLALVARRRGDEVLALERMLACLDQGRASQDGFVVLLALQGLAGLAIDRGRPEAGVQLFAAADALGRAHAWPIPNVFRALFDQDLAAARSATGAPRFESLCSVGRSLTIDSAIDQARAAVTAQRTPRAPADPLTPREREVAILLAEGLSNRQIAERLVITEKTVAVHVEHILAKLELRSRWQVVDWLNR